MTSTDLSMYDEFVKDVNGNKVKNYVKSHNHATDAVFDFQEVDPDFLSNGIKTISDEAVILHSTNRLFLPFDRCAYLVSDRHICSIHNVNHETIQTRTFFIHPNNLHWTLVLILNIKRGISQPTIPAGEPWRPSQSITNAHANLALSLTYLLALPKSHSLDIYSPDPVKNKNRRMMGRPPLVAYRRVRVDVAWLKKTKRLGPKGTHASPVGHDRRAHKRRLASGELIDITCCKINGGGLKSGPYTTAIIEQPRK